jgi:hypothetical protein
MKLRILLASATALLMASPALAALKSYSISGDQSTLFPTCGTVFRPGTQSGIVTINDAGNGTPTLVQLRSQNIFTDLVGGTSTTGIPGTTVTLNSRTVAEPTAGQTGTGNTATTISWGGLSGWTQTGRLNCTTYLPGGGTPPPSSCVLFVGFEGTGPPAPLKAGTFVIDPMKFTIAGGTDEEFNTPSVEFVSLGLGAVTANIKISGKLINGSVPALPMIGVAGLGAALLYLGARAVRSRKS